MICGNWFCLFLVLHVLLTLSVYGGATEMLCISHISYACSAFIGSGRLQTGVALCNSARSFDQESLTVWAVFTALATDRSVAWVSIVWFLDQQSTPDAPRARCSFALGAASRASAFGACTFIWCCHNSAAKLKFDKRTKRLAVSILPLILLGSRFRT